MRFLVGLIFVSLASTVQAAPKDLIGKWMAGCNQANAEATRFGRSTSDFKADGTMKNEDHFFADSQCAGALIGVEKYPDVKYRATENLILVENEQMGHKAEISFEYQLKGSSLLMECTQIVVDGQKKPLPDDPHSTMTRIP